MNGPWNITLLLVVLMQSELQKQLKAQPLQGVIFQQGTSTRLAGCLIRNMNGNYSVGTDRLGTFTIEANPGDTLEFRCLGYLPQKQVVRNHSALLIYLRQSNVLSEVVIQGKSLKQELTEVEDQFRSKGIFYKGKPPLGLLSPFGGSPVTFFYELLSKDGKRARRFSKYAERQLEYQEITSRFNDRIIKSTIPIKDEELAHFKSRYRPKLAQLHSWSDFDLSKYIKKSYEEFRADPLIH